MPFSFRAAIPPLALGLAGPGSATQSVPQPSAVVEVTATRFPEDPAKVPASITVITGQDLLERGATDLKSALALAAGVFIAPGGDGGPASSVPEFWGLKEFDAFLLVVDGVPWGGAFNPDLSTLSLQDVERIEVQRGAAPVMFGATSFVGIIHVIHRNPADARNTAQVAGGSHGSHDDAVTLRLPRWAGFDSSLTVDHANQGFKDPRTGFTRDHLAWRNRMELAEGSFRFSLDGTSLDQTPGSPHLREGKTLSTRIPLDANQNPDGAFIKDRRVALAIGYDQVVGSALWTSTFSVARSRQNLFRGFLTDPEAPLNANGYREQIDLTDVYLDSHLAWERLAQLKVVVGVDHLYGQGTGRGGDFDYFVKLDGSAAPGSSQLAPAKDMRIADRRDFSGAYGFAEWMPHPRLVLEAGLRLNRIDETRRIQNFDFVNPAPDPVASDGHRTIKGSGSVGLTWTAWTHGSDVLHVFANHKNTFKPAAFDFGVDSEARLLDPETAKSYEVGLKTSLANGRLAVEVSTFRMDFTNLVASRNLVKYNSGKQRFQGVEAALVARFAPDLAARVNYSYHDTRFTDFPFEFVPGVPTQLRGNRLEMSPYHLGSLGLLFVPAQGFMGTVEASYVGAVYLNKRNTASAAGYTTWAASIGYRVNAWDLRLQGQNLTDRRDPVAESEMGESQYYLMTGRRVSLSLRFQF